MIELEKHLLIFPDKRGIKQFYKLVQYIQKHVPQLVSDEYFTRVENLTQELKPAESEPVAQNIPTGKTHVDISAFNKMAHHHHFT